MSVLDELNPQNFSILTANKFISSLNNLEDQQFVFTNPLCFNEGSLILTINPNGEEEWVKIENLYLGKLVKTYLHGYRKIKLIGSGKLRNNVNEPWKCMYKLPKNGNNIFEDLVITGAHSILVDKIDDDDEYSSTKEYFEGNFRYIDDKILLLSCVSKKFIKLTDDNEYTYYHLVLENDGDITRRYGVWANGVLTETTNEEDFIGCISVN
jgi:hypothetical protein